MYLAWAAFYEGDTDAAYYDILLPRVLDDILLNEGQSPVAVPDTPAMRLGKFSRAVEMVAAEICEGKDAFYVLFVHADTGGRSLEAGIKSRREAFAEAAHELCGWPLERAIKVSPRHETEAWALMDGEAVCRALGYRGAPAALNIPSTPALAEGLVDPKAELNRIVGDVSGRRRRSAPGSILTAIAQEQSIAALRHSASFQEFERDLRVALRSLGCLPQ